jgi:hypothetical protein
MTTTVLLDAAPVPLDTPASEVDALWAAYTRYEDAYLAKPGSGPADQLRSLWQRAHVRVRRAAKVAATAARALAPGVVAFLRELGRMAADLHWEEASSGKR